MGRVAAFRGPTPRPAWRYKLIQKRWIDPQPIPEAIRQALSDYAPIERALLAGRGLRSLGEAQTYLARRSNQSSDPLAMAGMEQAVDRLLEARQRKQRVVVYGDYDADGTTATALLVEALQAAGVATEWYIPNRFTEGYGLNSAALRSLADDGAELVVSVDCGIRAKRIIERAPVDVIVTDHHLPGEQLPAAVAVLNPHRMDDKYPFKGLSGVGIAYKLAQAVLGEAENGAAEGLLDLVAVGTVADLAPLAEENRRLVWEGLTRLNAAARPGLRALAEFAGYRADSLDARSIGFGLGPRLNAAGRLGDAGEAVRLLLAPAGPEAWERASTLDALNRDRQRLTSESLEVAQQLTQRAPLAKHVRLAVDESFHEGVVGLVASRLAERAYRPALIGVREGSRIRGSARSIPEFHITEALDRCADLLVKYGGHSQAAGFTLESSRLAEFAERMDSIAGSQFEGQDLAPEMQIDAILGFDQLNEQLMLFIDQLEPCGPANPYPLFQSNGVVILAKRAVGADRRHLKLSLRQLGIVFDAIGFRLADRLPELPRVVDLVYRLERNEFRGVVSLQLNVQDIRPGRTSAEG